MMRHLILWSFLLLIVWSCVTAKSIQKRQACSNGCGTCQGKTCNVCNNGCSNSCSSSTCNTCVDQCSNNCNTQSCKNNCVSGCSNTCQSSSCQVQSCSKCINKCSNECSTDSCVNDCTSRCDYCKETRPLTPDQPIIMEPPQPSSVIVNNTNNNLVNLTTHINIDNIVNNYNNISVPIYVNTTNINNIDLTNTETKEDKGSTIIVTRNESNPIIHPPPQPPLPPIVYPPPPYPYYPPANYPQPPPPSNENNCCYVMHPRRCYTDENGNARCYIRRHRECSSSCTSPVVTIQEDEQQTQSGCYYTQNYPYVYCGNYVKRDCGQCYNCNGNYNPSECSRESSCPNVCRRSIPNCVPSQSGLQCY